ncbi:MAG: uroporphyrinogen-III C-methyltransferase [Thermoplasmata archaeon]
MGAGPGDPGLLTIRGKEVLKEADVVLADRLVGEAILASIPGDKVIRVGKRPGGGRHTAESQEDINRMMVEMATQGKVVVRLKGGDSFIFGRGGEEVQALAAARIDFEVVPGVTSAIAAPATFGIPVTHRDMSSLVTIVTGHEGVKKGSFPVDFRALASVGGTIVVLMGVSTMEGYIGELLEGGMDPSTAVAVIEKGTLRDQRMILGSLADIVERVRDAKVGPPAVVVIGRVVELAKKVVNDS